MRYVNICLIGTLFFNPVQAQVIQRSSSANGVQIQSDAEFKADQGSTSVSQAGEAYVSKSVAGEIKADIKVQGKTNISASQTNSSSIAVGKNNDAGNQAGVIGGK